MPAHYSGLFDGALVIPGLIRIIIGLLSPFAAKAAAMPGQSRRPASRLAAHFGDAYRKVEGGAAFGASLSNAMSGSKLKTILALHAADPNPKRFVPFICTALNLAMRYVFFPGFYCLLRGPVRDRNSNFLPCGFEAQKARLL